jgi:hypothetical protein
MTALLPDITVESWDTLLRAIDDVLGSQQQSWFRGQEKHEWRLQPSINRYLRALPPEQASNHEINAIMQFMGEAHAQLPATALPRDPFGWDVFDNYVEWLALMQHHGAPTRLLDWSLSPYVALYFAVSGEPDADAALWYFDQSKTWEAFCARYGIAPTAFYDYRVLPSTELTNPTSETPFLFCARKKMRSAREIAQQGVFTFADQLLADHQDTLVRISNGTCGRIRIPAALKLECGWRLRTMNLTPAALFPGVDGVCQSIRQDFERLRAMS